MVGKSQRKLQVQSFRLFLQHPHTEISGVHTGYEYARTQNPTREKLEACIAGIEKCKFGISFSSGLAAGASILDMLPANSHIIALDDLYEVHGGYLN